MQQSALPGETEGVISHLKPSIFPLKTLNNVSQWEFNMQYSRCASIKRKAAQISGNILRRKDKNDFSLCGIHPICAQQEEHHVGDEPLAPYF